MKGTWIIAVGVACLTLVLALDRWNPAVTKALSSVDHGADAAGSTAPPEQNPRSDLVSVDLSRSAWLPRTCPGDGAQLDVVFHFHGVPQLVAEGAERAGLVAAIIVENEGELSDTYTNAWSAPNSFERLLAKARRDVATHCSSQPELGRIALSSFSAGFAAIQELLQRESVMDRVDAVLLADSLYAAYADPEAKVLSRTGLEPFLTFARKAKRGDKLMAITHSHIRTQGYASTVATADYLLHELDLRRVPASDDGGTVAESGDFWLRGLPGQDAGAHGDHLRSMGETVLARLARRW